MVDPLLLKALKQTRLDIQQAQAEIETLRQAISSFEALVNQRLGGLLDGLSELEVEVASLTDQVRQIRDQHLYGEHQMGYVEGAPIPEHGPARQYIPHQDAFSEPPVTASLRSSLPSTPGSQTDPKTELKRLYRRLARAYHPDLAVSDGDRAQRTRQMVHINQAYTAGDLPALRKLSQEEGLEPFVFDFLQPDAASLDQMPELERLQHRLQELRRQITRLNNHPNLQLSLEVKLARQRGKDLLGEMARELQRKIARKTAERDYLRSQIAANQSEPKL